MTNEITDSITVASATGSPDNEGDVFFVSTDEPPIGGFSGSFYLDIPNDIRLSLAAQSVNMYGVTYNKYDIVSAKVYTGVGKVEVLAEKRISGMTDYKKYFIDEGDEAKVKIWLMSQSADSPTNGPCDVVIQGKGDGAIFTRMPMIETNHPYKTKWTKRFFYGSSEDHTLRVKKWQVVTEEADQTNTTGRALYEDEGQDMFHFYFYLHHED